VVKPLIDADILLYEIGYGAQKKDGGEWTPSSWDHCQGLLEDKVDIISDEVGATEPPLLFLTNQPFINERLNKRRTYSGDNIVVYRPNFREAVAGNDRPYKGTRKPDKPVHYYNLITHIMSSYDTVVMENGLEADDGMCIYQNDNTIICSRDKDVRQMVGAHYSWECGKQNAIGPYTTDELGYIILQRDDPRKDKPNPPKIFGYGDKYFYSQILSGDSVDNIGGAKKVGVVGAYNLLWDAPSSLECFERVKERYQSIYKEEWENKLRQAIDLTYMIRKLDDLGEMVKWVAPLT
jgi:hypothetical protein